MNTAKENGSRKSDYELLFKDSPEYFVVENARMLNEGPMVVFRCFSAEGKPLNTHWYPRENIHRIKSYAA